MIKDILLQQFPDLTDLRVRDISVDKVAKKILCTLSYPDANNALDAALRRRIFDAVKSQAPHRYYCTTTIKNDLFNAVSFKTYVRDTIRSHFLSLSDVDNESIKVIPIDGQRAFEVKLLLTPVQLRTAQACDFQKKFYQYTQSYTCYNCVLTLEQSGNSTDIQKAVEAQQKLSDMAIAKELLKPIRRFAVKDVYKYIGKTVYGSPMYIIDVREPRAKCILCGVISDKSIKPTKNPTLGIVKFTLKDKSGSINCLSFLRYLNEDASLIAQATGKGEAEANSLAAKNSAHNEKIRKLWMGLYDGTEVVVEGKIVYSAYSSALEMQVLNLSKCRIDYDSVRGEVVRNAPQNYVAVAPTAYSQYKQLSLTDNNKASTLYWKYNTVVVSFSATGNNYLKDKIVALSCAKLQNGMIVETLDTFVNPETEIKSELLSQIGQTARQLLYCPTFTEIIGDLYKFFEGCVIVGYNADTLAEFLQYYGSPIGYRFSNEFRGFADVAVQLNLQHNAFQGNVNFNSIEDMAKVCKLSHTSYLPHDKCMILAQCLEILAKD